ncbi:hypothetical protein PF005_g712 [Phytophthora fragariae]|uniref:Uncharacterized protein n=1 Tax=Phytophthora fragariae TaxID=53985 RepID=A0A6A3G809_9STRA|nr:hypothetical protein PF003_g8375 [Phytophthora fragariae]KAE8950118.1 hypothetical protein PF009_g336 [Phytophthora fragariae]KAE9031570.1 hypothetical protein PF011_g22 [Phytophthora fragariae]KAE9140220.1 hypothetical protein PF010_g272 [Phytophthora fragariae]KAE9141333.1 hypothetical protein PF007_g279 [Phytophthora fragariae]
MTGPRSQRNTFQQLGLSMLLAVMATTSCCQTSLRSPWSPSPWLCSSRQVVSVSVVVSTSIVRTNLPLLDLETHVGSACTSKW